MVRNADTRERARSQSEAIDKREILRMRHAGVFDKHRRDLSDHAGKMCTMEPLALGTQPGSTRLDDTAIELGHTRGRRALSRRERKDMQPRDPALFGQPNGIFEHLFALGRKS